MRHTAPFLASLAVWLGLFGSLQSAQFPPPSLGLQMQLTTGLAKIEAPNDPANLTPVERRRSYVRSGSFPASVALANLSSSDLALVYPSQTDAAARFTFRLIDQKGAVIWLSTSVTENAPTEHSITLESRAVWRRTVQIPLTHWNGVWLPPGRYTLRVDAGQASASVPFEITAPALPAGTGIKGQVLFDDQSNPGVFRPPFTTEPLPGFPGLVRLVGFSLPLQTLEPIAATVTISEIRLPNARYDHPAFSWTGQTDAEGHFQVATPAGTFSLDAHSDQVIEAESLIARPLPTVAVQSGHVSTQNFVIPGTPISPHTLVHNLGTATVDQHTSDPGITVSAYGYVNTGGWSNPRLIARPATEAGIIDLDFAATPPAPGTIVAQVFLPTTAVIEVPNPGTWTEVRIHSATNTVTATVNPVP